jgi:electron transfer flavoprotein beta subunit
LKILVGIKQVPDTETKLKIAPDGKSLDETGVKWILSPYDEFAVEEGLRIREASGGEVVVVCAGRSTAQGVLREALAMGADRALLIEDPRYERSDGLTRARALAAVVTAEGAELVLLGKYGVGTDEGQTGPMLAELLDWPHVAAISKLELGGERFVAEREIEGAIEVHEGRLPAVLTCDKGLNEPRFTSLKGIMQAKKRPLDTKKPEELGLDPADLARPRLEWASLELPPPRSAGRLIEGDPATAARELVRLLRSEAKVL